MRRIRSRHADVVRSLLGLLLLLLVEIILVLQTQALSPSLQVILTLTVTLALMVGIALGVDGVAMRRTARTLWIEHEIRTVRAARWRWTVALAGLTLAAFATNTTGYAASSTIGRTWPLAEPDALSEIEARTSRLAPMKDHFGTRDRWRAMRAAALRVTSAPAKRTIVPTHILDQDIRLPDGRLLYPKGYRFNPLSYVHLPQRLIVVHARDLGWALRQANPTDFILLASDRRPTIDAIALGNKVRRPLFLLEERVKDRLRLTVAPVIIRQIGQTLELDEIPLRRPPGSPSR